MNHTISPILHLVVFLIGLLAFLQVYAIQAILPIIVQEFLVANTIAGVSVGITIFAIALVSPFIGSLSDRIGRTTVIVPAIFVLSLPTALIALADSITLLNIARFLQGLCVPAMTVVLLAYLAEEFPKQVTDLTATYVMGTILGGFLGRFLLGHLHTLIGWRLGFIVLAGITLLGAMVVAHYLPKSTTFTKTHQKSLGDLVIHLKNPALLTLCGLGGSVLFSLVGAFTFINLHLANSPYHLSTDTLANLFSIYLIGMFITPISTKLINYFGATTTLFLAVTISLFGLILTLSSPLWLIIIGLTLLSSSVFITQTATISRLSTTVRHGRSLANGLYYSGYYLGGTLGAWACGIAFAHHSWQGVVALIALVQGLGLILIACHQRQRLPQN